MGANSAIEWTHHTHSPWRGCTAASPACDNCYAEHYSTVRFGLDNWGAGKARVRASARTRALPLAWSKAALAEHGLARVFCLSQGDIGDIDAKGRKDLDSWRAELFETVRATMARAEGGGGLVWMFLSKRRETQVPADLRGEPAIWEGFTAESQEWFDRRWAWAKARGLPATLFVSCEPLLGPIVLPDDFLALGERAVVISGGEACVSTEKSRPTHPAWHRGLRDQCAPAGVSYHFKQWGDWWFDPATIDAGGAGFHRFADGTIVERHRKSANGRLLDGRTHDGMAPAPFGRRWIARAAAPVEDPRQRHWGLLNGTRAA